MTVPAEVPHICVCICTFRREAMLKRLLTDLAAQQTGDLFTYSVVVADNDEGRSAAPIAAMAAAAAPHVAVTYCVQPRRNIALTRNTAIAHATGDFIAFIDDDEWPTPRWLLTLFTVCRDYGVDGVLGPVKPHFAEQPPAWIATGGFYDRPSYPTGFVIDWRKGRTGNVLLARRVFEGEPQPFREEFLTGEDQDFFRRMIDKGRRFVWCNEAIAYETVPPIRWQRTFMLKRALLRGAISQVHPTARRKAIATSI
ncbi:MAG TPA: glycosyltransferase family A protein, partial [Vicinamibacterales bacterium]|nr:glycosyltransferase family A protein [Vicinamibacterales bacterium]